MNASSRIYCTGLTRNNADPRCDDRSKAAPDRPNIVILEGPLVGDDEDQFAIKIAFLASAFVAFSSDGGSLAARRGENL